ncbi:tyrosine-protein phosphatase [Flavihumibacter petaseus]|nr:CpsB/CapC family capsule biosynthesis tyrosine phosphatase [Flavihumibacter petaseus]
MHSHILPGIDDGASDPGTSLQLITALQDLGLSSFVATPHILWDLYRNDDQSISTALDQLNSVLNAQPSGAVPLQAAAEYMMDDHFSQLVEQKKKLRAFNGNHVLVEFSFVAIPYNWKQLFFDMQMNGYQPVLAHPERYAFLSGQTGLFREMVEMGILLQLNLNSLTGYYGKSALSLATVLIKQQLISYLGTDCHHDRHVHALRDAPHLNDAVQHLLDSGKILNASIVL